MWDVVRARVEVGVRVGVVGVACVAWACGRGEEQSPLARCGAASRVVGQAKSGIP